MQVIKKVLLILYTLILGFIVFCNTSVFADTTITQVQTDVWQTSNGFDDYFRNINDEFDYLLINNQNKNGFKGFYNYFWGGNKQFSWNYFVLQAQRVPTHENDTITYARGYVVYVYAVGNNASTLQTNSTFSYADIENFNYLSEYDRSMRFQALNISYWDSFIIYNNGNNFDSWQTSQTNSKIGVPLCLAQYSHPIINDYLLSSTSGGQLTTAINNQTNTIKNESAKVTSAIQNQTQATKEQTNALLDTNSTGNETMSVNDTTSDTSANLGGLYNQIDEAFTSDAVILFDSHTFNLTLPNGDTFPIVLKTQFFRSFLDNNPVFKAFYQSIFWVIFGGYVIFDFKKIINKMKEGNIDNVVGSSNPVDSVVNMSLK